MPPPATDSKVGRLALDLVYHAAEVVKSIEDHANELETRARALAGEAIERLKVAEKHIQEFEAKQQAANACASETHIKVQEAAQALKAEQARVIAAEKQLRQLEMEARNCRNARESVRERFRPRRGCHSRSDYQTTHTGFGPIDCGSLTGKNIVSSLLGNCHEYATSSGKPELKSKQSICESSRCRWLQSNPVAYSRNYQTRTIDPKLSLRMREG